MDLTALVDLLAQRVAQEINAVRDEMLALLSNSATSAASTGLLVFDGGDAFLAPARVLDGGSAV